MHINHTPECQTRFLAWTEWNTRWPNACKTCNATGWIHDPGVYRYPDGSGDPPSTDLCTECVGKEVPQFVKKVLHLAHPNAEWGCCPRCACALDVTDFINDFSAAVECPHCGWAGGAGAEDRMPEVDCDCWISDAKE